MIDFVVVAKKYLEEGLKELGKKGELESDEDFERLKALKTAHDYLKNYMESSEVYKGVIL